MRITLFDALRLDPKFEPCRQERRPSLLPASPLPRLQVRGDFPHTKRSVPERSVPDSPMLRTPPVHREDSIPRVRRWVNQIHGSATRERCCEGWLPFNGTRKDEADRWERSAYLNQSVWECSRSLERVWEGASTNGLGTVGGLGCALHSMRDEAGKVQWRISTLTAVPHLRGIGEPAMRNRISPEWRRASQVALLRGHSGLYAAAICFAKPPT